LQERFCRSDPQVVRGQWHISHILREPHLANRTQLALYALRTDLARPAAG
jgi:hypothetical protein